MMTTEEYTEIRSLIPEDVYARFGGMSGAGESYALILLLREILQLRKDVEDIRVQVGA